MSVKATVELKGWYQRFLTFTVLPLSGVLLAITVTVFGQEEGTCGGNIIGVESGEIRSPGYPVSYGNDTHCIWIIQAPEDNVVKLTFTAFDLESSLDCRYDHVKITDGPSSESPTLRTFCGHRFPVPSSITSSGNAMRISFKTDDSLEFPGFLAEYTSVPVTGEEECANQRNVSSVKWLLHQGYCYAAVSSDSLTYAAGKEYCRRNGAYLVSIHSPQEMSFIQGLVQRYRSSFWIGLRKERLLQPSWEDGTPVDYLNWPPGETPEDDEDYGLPSVEGSAYGPAYNEEPTCVVLQAPASFWKQRPCTDTYHVICKYKNDIEVSSNAVTAPSASVGFCPDEWYTFGNQCYKVVGISSTREQKNLFDAFTQCETMSSSLVSIHSAQEQGFINTLLVTIGSKTWIGLHRTSTRSPFGWTDNSALDYSNWNAGEPNDHLDGNENCVQLLYSAHVLGKWNDVPCNLRFPFICKRSLDSAATAPGADPTRCTSPEGWLKIATSCYKVFHENTSSVSWPIAQSLCEGHQANLATVKNFQETADLSSHLEDLEGYFWIGISSSPKHRYTWVGRAPLIYTNWQADQPRDVSEESNCVAVNTDGEWMVRDCNESLPFICEVNEAPEVPTLPPHHGNMTCPGPSRKWHDFGGKYCYIIQVNHRLKWYEAYCKCKEEGGFLASFHSTNELNVILHHLRHFDMFVHIGFQQQWNGRFIWVDGSPVDFVNWSSDQPNSNIEQCATMSTTTGKWSDIQCAEIYGYICSALKVPEGEEFTTPISSKQVGEDQLSPGLISLIAISVLALLVTVAVVLYFVYRSPKSESDDTDRTRVPFARLEQ